MLQRIISISLGCVLLIHNSAEKQTNVTVTEKCVDSVCFNVPEFDISTNSNCSCEFYDFGEILCVENTQGFIKYRHFEQSTTDIINSSENPFVNLLYYLIVNVLCKKTRTGDDERYFAVIDTCPEGKKLDSTVKDLCEKADSELPMVLLSSPLNVVFQNAYCAKCHGTLEGKYTVTAWPSNIICDKDKVVHADDLRRNLQDGTCKREYALPQTELETYCLFPTIAKHLLQTECVSCFRHLENGQEYGYSLDCILCQFGTRLDVDICLRSGTGSTLKSLFNLPKDNEVKIQINGGIFKSSNLCKDNEKYDLLFQKCREFVCKQDEFASKGRCFQNRTVVVSPESQPFPNGQENLFIQASMLEKSGSNYARDTLISSLQEVAELLGKPNVSSYKGGTSIKFDLKLTKTNESSLDRLFQMSRRLYIDKEFVFNLILNVYSNRSLINNSVCPIEGYVFDCLSDSNVQFYEDVLYSQYLDEEGNRTLLFPVENIYFDLTMDSIDDELYFNNVCACIPPNTTVSLSDSELNCSYTSYKYAADEFQILAGGKLKLHDHQLVFEESEFYMRNGTAIVCYNPNKPRPFFNLDPAQFYLSWTCTGLSIICLIITVIIYSIFDELRNVPGRITMSLSLCLILGQGLLLFPDLGVGVCRYVAAVSHFVWLSAFLWMGCQAVNMALNFHPKTVQSVDAWKSSGIFNWYLLVSSSIPFIIVCTCLVLDMIPGEHLHVMYGLLSCSWMSNSSGIIYAFFVPVGLTLVANIICFSLALYFIEKTMANTDKVTGRRRDRSRCIMYMKLSTLMGFSWIFGFVASFFDVNELWYVYIVLNGLQGVFIFLGFGINKRVRNIISSKMSSFTTFHDLFSSDNRSGDNTQSTTARS